MSYQWWPSDQDRQSYLKKIISGLRILGVNPKFKKGVTSKRKEVKSWNFQNFSFSLVPSFCTWFDPFSKTWGKLSGWIDMEWPVRKISRWLIFYSYWYFFIKNNKGMARLKSFRCQHWGEYFFSRLSFDFPSFFSSLKSTRPPPL